jgi:hypothetical protein
MAPGAFPAALARGVRPIRIGTKSSFPAGRFQNKRHKRKAPRGLRAKPLSAFSTSTPPRKKKLRHGKKKRAPLRERVFENRRRRCWRRVGRESDSEFAF